MACLCACPVGPVFVAFWLPDGPVSSKNHFRGSPGPVRTLFKIAPE